MIRSLLGALAALLLTGAPAMAIEEPSFAVEARAGAFEIRDYAPMIVAEVTTSGGREAAINDGFQLLAEYIFGGNTPKAKIAMTAPVTQSAARGEKIAMTAPVTQSGDGASWIVRFVMPKSYALDALPQPNNPAVRLLREPGARMAVVRFSGGGGTRALDAKTAELEAFIAARGEIAIGPATYAFYDPPWTPPFLRRNEVMIPLRRPE